jgi:hypothetical protein
MEFRPAEMYENESNLTPFKILKFVETKFLSHLKLAIEFAIKPKAKNG